MKSPNVMAVNPDEKVSGKYSCESTSVPRFLAKFAQNIESETETHKYFLVIFVLLCLLC